MPLGRLGVTIPAPMSRNGGASTSPVGFLSSVRRLTSSARRVWFPVLAAIPVVTFLATGLFAAPNSDDFCYANTVSRYGFWGGFENWYLSWTGRYTASAILMLPGYLDHQTFFAFYSIIPISLILALLLAVYFLLETVNKFIFEGACAPWKLATGTIAFTSIYLLNMERPNEVLYWFAGAVSYQLANVLFIVLSAMLIRLHAARTLPKQIGLFLASTIFVLFIAGLNETAMTGLLTILALLMLLSFANEHPSRFYRPMMMGIFFAALVASLIVVLAPGNHVRVAFEETQWGASRADSVTALIQAAATAMLWAAFMTLHWLIREPLHALVTLIAVEQLRSLPTRLQERVSRRHLLWLPAIAFVAIWAMAFTSFYIGKAPVERAVTPIYLPFWLSFVAGGAIIIRHYQWEIWGRRVPTALAVALAAGILLHPNHVQAISDFKNEILYKAQREEREAMVNAALHRRIRHVVVPKLMRLPTTIHVSDLSAEENHYHNRCYAEYQQIDGIVAQGDGDTDRIVTEIKSRFKSRLTRLLFRTGP